MDAEPSWKPLMLPIQLQIWLKDRMRLPEKEPTTEAPLIFRVLHLVVPKVYERKNITAWMALEHHLRGLKWIIWSTTLCHPA